ncbi:MAG: carboxypeptidase regulatory-like domain-containing protein [Acidobacteriota bacterium]
MMKRFVCSASVPVLLFAAACGGGDSSTPTPAPAPAPGAGTAPAAEKSPAAGTATGNGEIKGSIAFEGEAPKRKKISMGADPICQAAHTEPVFDDSVIVNDNGTLKDVFIYVKAGLAGGAYDVPTEDAIFDQHGCHYAPHVMGVQAGQKIKILNSDSTLHNVHALPTNNPQFNIAMPKFLKEKEVSFENPEVMIRVKCEVHPWMGAWIGVLDHPFFNVSDDTGAFSLSGLPAGDYTIEAWHEKYGQLTQQVSLGDGEVKELNFTFKAN